MALNSNDNNSTSDQTSTTPGSSSTIRKVDDPPVDVTGSVGSVLLGFTKDHGLDGMCSLTHGSLAGDTQSLPDDDSLLSMFQYMKAMYCDMVSYVNGGRQERLQEINALTLRIQNIVGTLSVIPPQARDSLAMIIDEQTARVQELQTQIVELDGGIVPARGFLKEHFDWYLVHVRSTLATHIKDFQWPTLATCEDLELPHEVVHMVISPLTGEDMVVEGEGDAKDQTIKELKNLVKELQQERLLWKQQGKSQGGHLGSMLPTDNIVGEAENRRVSEVETTERRRRVKIPSFSDGNVQEAKDWLAEYKSICEHVRFSKQEKLDDLQVRFKGTALFWYTYLLPDVKKRWVTVEKAFVEYFAGGENTVEAALNELKLLKQGRTRMVAFGQQLREVARRAEIYSERMLIGYLKSAVNPEMTRAIIYRGPTTYMEAVNICVEVETDLMGVAESKATYVPSYGDVTTTTTQNYQSQRNQGKPRDIKNIRCYKCQKFGHMKRDCRSKGNDRQGHYRQNEQAWDPNQGEVEASYYKDSDTHCKKKYGWGVHIPFFMGENDKLPKTMVNNRRLNKNLFRTTN